VKTKIDGCALSSKVGKLPRAWRRSRFHPGLGKTRGFRVCFSPWPQPSPVLPPFPIRSDAQWTNAPRKNRTTMSVNQFRFAYFTPLYEETVSFYLNRLGLPLSHRWDRSPDRGTVVRAASGMIEILALPPSGEADHLFDSRPPQGAFMVIEVDDVDAMHRKAVENELPIQQELKNQSWGHRSLCIREPNGLTLFFFTPIGGD
jgi:catechol 2,3-dioxygenase-like lactoylglutathione lyase family enzyme